MMRRRNLPFQFQFQFQFPVYFLGRQILVVPNQKELGGLESWFLYDNDHKHGHHPFDANFNRLASEEIRWSGGGFELFIDANVDHSNDQQEMRDLLVKMLSDALEFPHDLENKSFDQLLALAIRECPE